MTDHPIAPEAELSRHGELVGDRACAKCHFNLAGQTIVRERHYGMLMVRCPECGTPAALQEYPLLGRWAARLGYVVAASWMFVVLGLVCLTALAMWGMSESMRREMAQPYATFVQQKWTEYANGSGPPNPYAYSNYQQNQKWWEDLDKKQLFADAGGWGGAISWRALWFGLTMIPLIGGLGILLAIVMPHLRTKGRFALVLVVGGLAGIFSWVSESVNTNTYMYYGGWGMAWKDLNIVLLPVSLGIAMLCLCLGVWVGRPLARGLVLLLLPPRLRGPMSFLWLADGKRMPRAA